MSIQIKIPFSLFSTALAAVQYAIKGSNITLSVPIITENKKPKFRLKIKQFLILIFREIVVRIDALIKSATEGIW